jgi:uncharacterized membrane protein
MVNRLKQHEARMRSLAWLGLLLQGLGAMFGVTAFIGMFINVTKLKEAKGTIYESHLRWQIVTFWLAVLAAIVSYTLYAKYNINWPMILAVLFVIYRMLTSLFMLIEAQPIKRWL